MKFEETAVTGPLKAMVSEVPPRCTVQMDGANIASGDFVAVLMKDDGDMAFLFHTDAMTMGMTLQMVSKAFVGMMAELSEAERDEINDILNGGSDEEN